MYDLLKQRKYFSQFSFDFKTFNDTRTPIHFQISEQAFSRGIIVYPEFRKPHLKTLVYQKRIIHINSVFKQFYVTLIIFAFV